MLSKLVDKPDAARHAVDLRLGPLSIEKLP